MTEPHRPSYGYDPTAKKPYWSQPYAPEQKPETIAVIHPPDTKPNYSMPKAMVPSILMVMFGGINFIAFLTFALFSGAFHTEFFIATLVYLMTGIIGIIGAFKSQRRISVVYGLLLGGLASLVLCISQIVLRSELLSMEGFIYRAQPREAPFLIGFSIILLMIAIVIFFIAIALVIFPSKIVCSCCRRRE